MIVSDAKSHIFASRMLAAGDPRGEADTVHTQDVRAMQLRCRHQPPMYVGTGDASDMLADADLAGSTAC